jgi:hypothetical protein
MALKKLPHIRLVAPPGAEAFQRAGGGGSARPLPQRDRQQHAETLLRELRDVQAERERRIREAPAAPTVAPTGGMRVEFELEAGFPDAVASLEDRAKKIELVAIRPSGEGKILATVFVPRDQLVSFARKIERYETKTTSKGRPRHESLVATIAAIRLAALRDFWTDDDAEFPEAGNTARWEVWIRDEPAAVDQFLRGAGAAGIEISETFLAFPERRVYLARATPEQMAASVDVLDAVAEVRRAKESRAFFVALRGPESKDWVDDLLRRTTTSANPSAICLLDSGVNAGHPLLDRFTDAQCRLSARPAWGPNDQIGHGTRMAGLALFGDLAPLLAGSSPVDVYSSIESVKLLPPPPQQNPDELHGVITRDAVNLIEITDADRVRVFAMTVTTRDSRDLGQPSAWSAEIDQLAAGVEGGAQRLFVLSAGNSNHEARIAHPDHLATEQVHDPGQAWNAITVGACTDLWRIEEQDFRDWKALSPPGDLSPSTSTSVVWAKTQWPIKPDIVCEGGNCAIDPGKSKVDDLDSLSLLTTSSQPVAKLFTTAGETSAACAIASRIGGAIRTEYPALWPETVRGLLVHSSEWKQYMLDKYGQGRTRADVERLLRSCGFGRPSLERALWSVRNDLTLIAEVQIQPFRQVSRGEIQLNEMHLHRIPWPAEELRELGAADVELRITLSYFIEPNPARRGWIRRHRYASHGLRFDIQTPEENVNEFRARINRLADDEDVAETFSDAENWLVGPVLRSKGSLHTDIWKGSAVDLAAREHIAVYPVGGWWKERAHLRRGDDTVRYSLIVSIKSPGSEVDLYTPIATAVGVPVVIET